MILYSEKKLYFNLMLKSNRHFGLLNNFSFQKREFALEFETQLKCPSLEKCPILIATVCFESENEGKFGSSG